MIRVEGIPFDDMTRTIDAFERRFLEAAQHVMNQVADELGAVQIAAAPPPEPVEPPGEPYVSMDTLALITSLWAATVVADLGSTIADIYLEGAQVIAEALGAGLAEIGEALGPVDFDGLMEAPSAVDFLRQANNRMVRFGDELWAIARAQLLEGFMAGESIPKLRDRLRSVAGLSRGRASTVARTEVISASNAGSYAFATSAGFRAQKEWLATMDPRVRLTHGAPPIGADGQRVGLTEAFIVGGFPLLYPGDPLGPPEEIINCRCAIVYAFDEESPLTAAGGEMADEWIGVLCVEGILSGDGRMFTPGALEWATPPIPLRWQIFDDEGHKGAVIVGNITEVIRRGDLILGRGRFDVNGAHGAEARRMVAEGFLYGTSIDSDDIEAPDIEVVYGPGVDDDRPTVKEVRYHGGRVRAATLCAIPAFVEARISMMPEEITYDPMQVGEPIEVNEPMIAAAIRAHDTATTDVPWDKGANVKRLDSPMTLTTARAMYAWMDDARVEDGRIPKDGCKFPHHEVSADGRPGAANLAACSAGIGALHGARGGADIPSADRRGVYDHLAAHLRDGGMEPPEFQESGDVLTSAANVTVTEVEQTSTADVGALTAAAYVLTIPDVPPADWFAEPKDVEISGALTVTDEGRVYGYLAPANVPHRSFAERVTVPMGNVDYSLFMGRETITASGGRVVTGAITMDCGHASTGFRDPAMALDHYDNACSIVASVRIGENARGVWVAGALMPGLSANQVARMMACQLSGDWRPHRERPGWREFAGALLVPVPGFAMARTEASVKIKEGALVAAAVPVQYASGDCGCPVTAGAEPAAIASGGEELRDRAMAVAISIIEKSVGLDPATRIATMSAIVNR